ncbi:heme A synthase [Nocardioides iriomotensis]|uniref:Heme A synthase n=1 Tax=Nocardioides iriomotensis TaxID=715784 RepID=A0A4Q5IZF3_9ACTN|nr:heme A synthase [Nocardioides iriomotensis]
MGVTVTSSPAANRWLRPAAIASVLGNIAIVLTGGVVRLTGSGLGCPTWPRCTDESFVPHGALGIHGAIEFGNRMVTFLLAAIAVATFLVALRSGRSSLVKLSVVLGLGVPAQAVIGGITVLTDLNPWIVAFHLLVSLAMIAVAVTLLRRVDEGDGPAVPTVPPAITHLARLTFVVGWAVLYLGTVVTGSGPHAGDLSSPRNGLDPRSVSQLHTDAVFLLLGLTVALVFALRAVSAPQRAQRAAVLLLAVELAQGLVGFVQYFTDLPIVLVAFHLLGAALTSAGLAWVLVNLRERRAVAEPAAEPALRA